jgi:hypothetical protein
LSEQDPELTDRVILLADAKDGQPLAPNEGPFRIIVPGEKRAARWVRQFQGEYSPTELNSLPKPV